MVRLLLLTLSIYLGGGGGFMDKGRRKYNKKNMEKSGRETQAETNTNSVSP